jgi:sulfur-carrier protein adenylyltransferase/sulfurtransferase
VIAVPSITVEELKTKLDSGDRPTLLDVREPHEWPISDLPESVKIPLGQLPQRYSELAQDADLVVYCRTGGRSAQAVQFLKQRGYGRAANLTGGINRWAEAIDPRMRKY